MADFETAFKKPVRDLKKLVIGCLLNIIPIVNLFATGYLLKVAKMTMMRKNDLPEWQDWGDLFVKGLLAVVIGLLYAIPLLVVAFVALGSTIFAIITMGELNVSGFSIALLLVLFILTTIVAPSAIMNFVSGEKFGSAFEFQVVLRKAFTKDFLLAWFVSMMYTLLLGFLFSFIPMVGPAISGFVVGVTSFTLFAENYKKL